MIGTSLDGDVDDFAAIVEIKCPKSTTHVGYLDAGKLPAAYQPQIMHSLFVTGAKDAIFCSFDNRLPTGLELFVVDVKASDLPLEEYETALHKFLKEVADLEFKLLEMQHQSQLKKAA